jgi:flagella basal body P-ring formation protein FlgA
MKNAPRKTHLKHFLTLALAATLGLGALAPAVTHADSGPDPLAGLKLFLEKQTTGLPGRVEVIIGSIDPRLQLAPCSRIEPSIAPGVRLWGKVNIGLRCTEGAGWMVWLPVEIKVWGPALVANAGFVAGQSLAEGDVRLEEVELTREAGAITTTAQLSDKTLTRQVNAGQVLRQDQFRVRPVVNQGDMVKVVYQGPGFTVSTEAHALGQAMAGQSIRVQTASGKVLSGLARPGRVVEVAF